MKIYTQKQIDFIRNQALNKIFHALEEFYERENQSPTGVIKDRRNELLDIALSHFFDEPNEDVIYLPPDKLEGTFLPKKK